MDKEIKITPAQATELQNLREEVKHLEETVKELAQPEASTNNGHMVLLATVLVALVSVLIAAYFLFLRAPKQDTPVVVTPIASTTPTTSTATTTATITPVTIEVYKDSKPWYDVSIEYPNLPVAKDFIMSKYNSFTEDTKILQVKTQLEAKEVLGLMNPDWKYTFNSTISTASSSNTTSYIFETYTFTGGAHGSTNISAITLDTDGKVLPVEEILKTQNLPKIAPIARREILTEKRKRLSAGGIESKDLESILAQDTMVDDGTKPTRENYSVAWIDGDDVVVHFGQYQVGAYAEGMYNVHIKRTLLE
jgi:hypothetical protein